MKYLPEITYIIFLLFIGAFITVTIHYEIFQVTYLTISLIYLWYRYGLLAYNEVLPDYSYEQYTGKVSVVIAAYNEHPELLKKTVLSVIKSVEGIDSEIIVGDDGSKSPVITILDKMILDQIKVIRTEKNQGKRGIQAECLKHIKGDVTVLIDSDTVLKSDTIRELIKPFSEKNVGASTGQVKVLNESDNILTKATGALYWNAFNVGRQSLSKTGAVSVCSGALAAFRSELLHKFSEYYVTQNFFGVKVNTGDDHALTNMVLSEGFDVRYTKLAIAYTYSPPNLRAFMKQQLRWRRDMLRESLISLGFSWRVKPLLFVESIFQLLLPFINIVVIINLFVFSFIYPVYLTTLILGLVFVTFLHNLSLFFTDLKMVRYALVYSFLSELLMAWIWPIALLTLPGAKWGTR